MITLEKQIDELTKEIYNFYQVDNLIYLSNYTVLKRETTRKTKYSVVKKYDRLNTRDSSLSEDQVPFTEEIKAEAIKMYIDSLKIMLWSERKK